MKPGGIFVFSVPHPNMIYSGHDNKSSSTRSRGWGKIRDRGRCKGNKKESIFCLEELPPDKGYFTSRDDVILGYIKTIDDGEKLNIMSVH